MSVSVQNPGLQQRIQGWAQQQGIDKPVHDLSLGQMQKASRALDVSLNEVVQLREELVAAAAGQTQDAGNRFAATRDAAQGAALGHGGADAFSSPMLISHTWKGGGAGKGKGVASSDSDLAMSAMGTSRFASKVDVKQPFVDFKGYRGGSSDIDRFFKSTYSASDAEQAMQAFDFLSNMVDAKEYIGLKIANGYESMLADVGITPHNFDKHECLDAFYDSPYTMRDARRAVAELPFLSSLDEAKEYIGLKIVNGTEDILADRGIGPAGFQRIDNTDLFFKAGYTYEDAEAAVQAFDFLHSVGEAKDYMGLKVANGFESMLREAGISPGNFDDHEMMGAFFASRYSYEDAEAAMGAFDFLHSVSDAKEYIGLKVINGYESMLADAGITPSPFDAHEEMSSFRRSGYTETDARATLMAFDFLDSIDAAKEYIGLKVINGTEDILADVGVTRSDYDSHECLAAYAKAGYTNADCDKAAAGWGFLNGRDEAREYIGLKVLNGMEHMLAEVGVSPRGFNNTYDMKAKGGYWDKGAYDLGAGKYGSKYDSKVGGYGNKIDPGYGKGSFGYAKNWDYFKK